MCFGAFLLNCDQCYNRQFLASSVKARFPPALYIEAEELWTGEKDDVVIKILHHICRKLRDYDLIPDEIWSSKVVIDDSKPMTAPSTE